MYEYITFVTRCILHVYLFILVTLFYEYKTWNSHFLTLFLKYEISILFFAVSNGFLMKVNFNVFFSVDLKL